VIRERLGVPVELVKGEFGQFEVLVNGRMVASRKGGLIAKLVNRPWPDEEDVIAAIRSAGTDQSKPAG
jgi:hypothetical protein